MVDDGTVGGNKRNAFDSSATASVIGFLQARKKANLSCGGQLGAASLCTIRTHTHTQPAAVSQS